MVMKASFLMALILSQALGGKNQRVKRISIPTCLQVTHMGKARQPPFLLDIWCNLDKCQLLTLLPILSAFSFLNLTSNIWHHILLNRIFLLPSFFYLFIYHILLKFLLLNLSIPFLLLFITFHQYLLKISYWLIKKLINPS